jgi:hypothetical protein
VLRQGEANKFKSDLIFVFCFNLINQRVVSPTSGTFKVAILSQSYFASSVAKNMIAWGTGSVCALRFISGKEKDSAQNQRDYNNNGNELFIH